MLSWLTLSSPQSAYAHGALDQLQGIAVSGAGSPAGFAAGQAFTPTQNTLVAFDVYVCPNTARTATFTVRQAPFTTDLIAPFQVSLTSGINHIHIPGGFLVLTLGQKYAWIEIGQTGSYTCFYHAGSGNDVYPGGNNVFGPPANPTEGSTPLDYYFKTFYNVLDWTNVPGAAVDLAAGFQLWALGAGNVPGGRPIYQYVGGPSVWQSVAGGAEIITVAPDIYETAPWVAQNDASGNRIWRRSGGNWVSVPGAAKDLSWNDNIFFTAAYALGTTATPGGYLIYEYVGGAAVWKNIPGGAAQVAAASEGHLWARQASDDIFRWDVVGRSWSAIPGKARRLAAGAGKVYALGTIPVPGGYQIYRYVGGSTVWLPFPGAAIDLAVDINGNLWAVQDAAHGNAIYKCTTC